MFDYVFKRKRTWIGVFFLDLIGSLFFIFKAKTVPKPVRKILVIRLDHIGDLVLSTPFIKKIRSIYPAAEIDLLCDSKYAELMKNEKEIDRVLTLEGHWLDRKNKASFKSIIDCVKKIKEGQYDLGFDLRGDIRSIFYFLLIPGVKFRVAYGVRGGGFMLNHNPVYPAHIHQAEKNTHLISTLFYREEKLLFPELTVGVEEQKKMENRLIEMGKDPNKKIVIAHLGAGYASKQWPIERFVKVLEAIVDSGNFQVCLVGTKNELELTEDFLTRPNIYNFIGKTTPLELLGLTSLGDIFIGNDSGPAHLSSALNIPTLTIFSGTNRHQEWRPLGKQTKIIYKDVECSPCEEQVCPLKHHHCMEWITEEEVLETFMDLARDSVLV